MTARSCRRCGAALPDGARYCGACGAPTRVARLAARDRSRRERAGSARRSFATALVVTGALAVIAFVPGEPDLRGALLRAAALIGVGLLAARILGAGALRASLAARPGSRWLAAAIPGGLLAFLVSWGWIRWLSGLAAVEPAPEAATAAKIAASVFLAPLVEEWLCRGVLWEALRPATSRAGLIVSTAALFALLHGLELWTVSLPHRFIAGLVFGWLRAASASLAPGILAHAIHNAAAVLTR